MKISAIVLCDDALNPERIRMGFSDNRALPKSIKYND
jgi:hypothetical protein